MVDLEEKNTLKGHKNLLRYLSYFKKYKFLCFGFWSILAINGVISFLLPLILGKVISNITELKNFNAGIMYAIIYASLETLSLLLNILRVPFFKKLENNVKRDVKLYVIENSYNISVKEYDTLGNGLFVTRLTKDLDSLATTFKSISETIISFLSKSGFVIYIFIEDWILGLFILFFVILRYAVYQIRIHFYAKMKPKVLKQAENINSVVGESVRGVKDIKTLGLENNILTKIKNMQEEYAILDNNEWYVGSAMSSLASLVRILCDLCFIIISVYLIKAGRIELAIFYTVYVYKNNVMDFAVHLGYLQDYFKEAEVSAFRIFELTDENKYLHDKYGSKEINNFSGKIEFKNVSFYYDKKKEKKGNITNNML